MKKEYKFLKGFLSGVAIMLLISGIFFVIREVIIKDNSMSTTSETIREQVIGDDLYLDMEQVSSKIETIQSIINQYHMEPIDSQEVEDWTYRGMVAGLGERYASYYTREEVEANNESLAGQYEGIGAVLIQDKTTGFVTIVRCYEGGPAEEAGILPEDILYMVNDVVVANMELTEVVKKIKTEEGETVKITIARDGEAEYLEFDLERRAIEVPTITHEMLEDKVGYIVISEFATITRDQFKLALQDLEEQGMERMVVDLRGNPGGGLQTTCNMLEEILPAGIIVYTLDRDGVREEFTGAGAHAIDIPFVVLVNENSASASEIFAGAVQDYGVGTIVGVTTYGKGSVQGTIPLEDGSAVKMTVAKYYTPNGNDINGIGIQPDVEVELNEELKKQNVIEKEEDNQLQKALEVVKSK